MNPMLDRLGNLLGRRNEPLGGEDALATDPAGSRPPTAGVAPSPVAAIRLLEGEAKPSAKPGQRAVLAVTVLGLGGDSLERVLALVEQECAAQGMQPVFITDQTDFAPFRRRRLTVDQVVDAERRAVDLPGLPWQLYRHAQYKLLAKRWRPAAVISFGRLPDKDCLDALER